MKPTRRKPEKIVTKSAIWEEDDTQDVHELPSGSFWDDLMSLEENEDQWVTPVLHS